MAKKLAIFCDGTWNHLRRDSHTNVVRLAKCVAHHSADGKRQIVYYDEGVGVGSDVSWLADTATKYLGGALGRGLDRKIEAAYRFLVLNYEPGDDIYVFGFSRGAYTARSLCGMIRKCGILKRDCFHQVPEAIGHYREKETHPSSPAMVAFRTNYAHPLAAGEEDYERLDLEPQREVGQLLEGETRETVYQYRPPGTYRMMFVGIWDTVGALGVPKRYDWLKWNRRYKFHDTSASSLMSSIRHAVAANEERGLYDVTPVDNMDTLNIQWARATGWNVADPNHPLFVPYPHRPYQQRWLPGDHCSVGGGHKEGGLSGGALLWMAEGARWAGLSFTTVLTDDLAVAARTANPFADLGGNGSAAMPSGDLRGRGPAHLDEVSDPLYRRWEGDTRYRPPNMTVMRGAAIPMLPPLPLPPGFPRA